MRWKIAQWFEVRWWKRYLSSQTPEQYLNWKKDYWKSFLETLNIDLPNGKSILDAGCGPAGIFTILEGNQVTAIDPLIDQYNDHLEHFEPSRYPFVQFKNQQIESINEDKSYDIILCLNVINHVQTLNNSLDALVDSLKSNGTLVLSIDSHNFLLPKWMFRLAPLDILHPHQYDLSEYQEMLTSRGFQINRSVHLKSGFLFDYYAIVATKL